MSQLGLKQYQAVNQQSAAAYADPHQLIQMMYDGAIQRLHSARGVIENKGDIETKGNFISSAITLIEALRAYLDMEKGADIAENLANLYAYMERRLFDANYLNDVAIIDEVIALMEQLQEAWAGIREEAVAIFAKEKAEIVTG